MYCFWCPRTYEHFFDHVMYWYGGIVLRCAVICCFVLYYAVSCCVLLHTRVSSKTYVRLGSLNFLALNGIMVRTHISRTIPYVLTCVQSWSCPFAYHEAYGEVVEV